MWKPSRSSRFRPTSTPPSKGAIPAGRSMSSPSPAATRFTARSTSSCATTGSTPTTSLPTAPGRRSRRSSRISSAAPSAGRLSRTRPSSSPTTTGSVRSWGAYSSTPCRPLKMRQGDFSEVGTIYDPLTTVAVPGGAITRQPFPGNVIPQNRWDPVTAKLINAYPLPTTSALANNLVTTPTRTQDWNQFDVRIDHTQSERNNFLGRYSWSKTSTINPYTFARRPASRCVESGRSRQRGHLRGPFGSARGARRVRLGACVLAASGPGFARRLQPLQSRVHASRRRARRSARRTARRAQREPAGRAERHPDLQPGGLHGHRSEPLAADFPAREGLFNT